MLDQDECLDVEQTVEWIPALRAYARSLTRDDANADDLVQETLHKAIRNREKFKPGTNLRAWLFAIMRNTFFNDVRRARREVTGAADCVADSVSAPATQEWTIRGQEMMAAIDRLPTHYREMLILVVMLGETYERAGEICGCTMGTVKSRVNRARKLVADDLEREPVRT
ncbi:sigma-70 family RNA polymerase sigma factor [Roseivivax sediminis]|uniref:RNA polymerase sigma-70 factor, ECF subfamily n=1 Tax=Roseivivax sediminis TaxID=936889 RepID=A0A1I1VKV1_9RHOB|nr:sigma-70 family RNA polymerase sigma factor [Roseivivax sediminis]SFD83551.1 RNA polymerase sigma-70 factor, ECF subfamily [Roseivivax sediminis]